MSDNCGGAPYHFCLCATKEIAEREMIKVVEEWFTDSEKLESDYQERFGYKLQGLYIETEEVITE